MSDTNQNNHPEFVHIGPAVLGFYDETNDILVNVGKVDDIVFAKTVEDAVLTEIISGVATEVEARPIAESYRLRGIFRETLNPNTQYLFLKNCGTPSIDQCGIETITEKIQMFRGHQKILRMNNGFYGYGALPAPAGVAGTAYGAGAGIPAGTYTFVVTALFGTTESYYAESAPVVVGANQNVALDIDPPIVPTFDSLNVYVYDSGGGETRADADLILNTDSLNVWFDNWVRGASYPGDSTASFTVTDSTGTVTYDVGDDYSIDASCAMLCLIDDGAVDDGEWLTVTYSYYTNPKVSMSIGPANRLPKKGHLVIWSLKDDDRNTPIGRGFEMHLYHVMLTSGWEWNLSQMDFQTGFAFDWKVLNDPRKLKHGDVYTYHRQLATYGLMEFADLTEFTNQVDCSVAGS